MAAISLLGSHVILQVLPCSGKNVKFYSLLVPAIMSNTDESLFGAGSGGSGNDTTLRCFCTGVCPADDDDLVSSLPVIDDVVDFV